MPAVARFGDMDSNGDAMAQGSPNVFVNNLAVARFGDMDSNGDAMTQGSPDVFVNNLAVARFGDMDSNGDAITAGSPNVFVNGGGSGGVPSVGGFSAPEPPVSLSYYQKQQATFNIINAAKYDTPKNIEDGIAAHPEVPDDPAAPVVTQAPAIVNPNCTSGSGGDIGAALDQRLAEGNQWNETGKNGGTSNPNILQLSADVGIPQHSDQVMWCAAFAGSTLKNNCFKFMKSLSATSYTKYGNPVAVSALQKGDIVVLTRDGGHHIAFYYGPSSVPGRITVVGGNQGGDKVGGGSVTKSNQLLGDIISTQRPIPV